MEGSTTETNTDEKLKRIDEEFMKGLYDEFKIILNDQQIEEFIETKTKIMVLNGSTYPKIGLCNIDKGVNETPVIKKIMDTAKENVEKDSIWYFFLNNLKKAHRKIHALEAEKAKAKRETPLENKKAIKEDFYKKQNDEFLLWVKRNNAVNLEKDLKDFFLKKFSPEKYLTFLKIRAMLKYLLYSKKVAFKEDEIPGEGDSSSESGSGSDSTND